MLEQVAGEIATEDGPGESFEQSAVATPQIESRAIEAGEHHVE
jgi:hypothetical protein